MLATSLITRSQGSTIHVSCHITWSHCHCRPVSDFLHSAGHPESVVQFFYQINGGKRNELINHKQFSTSFHITGVGEVEVMAMDGRSDVRQMIKVSCSEIVCHALIRTE